LEKIGDGARASPFVITG